MEQIAALRPGNVAKAIRSLLVEDGLPEDRRQELGLPEETEGLPLRARSRAAILMLGLGSDCSADIMKYMSDYEIDTVTQAILELDIVTPQQKGEVFEEVRRRLVSGNILLQGGSDFAHAALEKALGPRRVHGIMDRVKGTQASGFRMLRNVDPHQIRPFLSKEHPQTIALILSQLDATQSGGILAGFPEDLQVDVARRLAGIDDLPAQALRRLEDSLAAELQAVLSGLITEIGGPRCVAEILNRTGPAVEKSVLERLDERDAKLAEEIRNQMFTFDDVATNLTDREIQLLLKEVDTKDLAIALMGASDELTDRILSNLSDRVIGMIKEEMDRAGPTRISDVEAVQRRIVATVRQLEEAGQISIMRGPNPDQFV